LQLDKLGRIIDKKPIDANTKEKQQKLKQIYIDCTAEALKIYEYNGTTVSDYQKYIIMFQKLNKAIHTALNNDGIEITEDFQIHTNNIKEFEQLRNNNFTNEDQVHYIRNLTAELRYNNMIYWAYVIDSWESYSYDKTSVKYDVESWRIFYKECNFSKEQINDIIHSNI
jgi:ribosomal protein L19